MKRYLLSVHTPADAAPSAMTDAEMREGFARISALEDEMKSAGVLLFSGRLDEPAHATVVRATNGSTVTTDGPFVEAKEAIGGFYIIEDTDDQAALEWASKTSACIGMPIEVRPFFDSRAG